jgi:peptide/nickel transport system substrate-binding protein
MFIIVRMKNKRTGAEDRMNQNEKKEMKIRIAKEEDAEALLAIYAPYIEHTVITYEYDVPTVEEFRGRIRHVLERYPYLVAELNGEICGYAYASAFHDRPAGGWNVETSIYVDQNKKGIGIGTALYDKLEKILKRQNILNMNACIACTEIEDEYLTNVSYNGKPISAEKVDDLTLNITLQEPNSAFETEFGRLQPLPKHVFKGTNVSEQTEAANKGIGSGPFKVKEYKEGESITYERYDDYYRGKASLDQVIIKIMPDQSAQEAALQSGELSVMRVTSQTKLDKYKKDDNYTVYNIPEGRLNYLAFNYQSEIMKNADARKAICLALNDDEIVEGAYGSEELAKPAKNFCSPENLYYNDEMKGYQQNIEEAKKLAKSSGLSGKTLHYIYFQQRPNMKETAQIVQQQLKKIDVNLEIEGMDGSAFFPHLFAAWISGGFKEDTSWDIASNGMDQMNADPATKMAGWTGDLVEKGFYVSPETKEAWKTASQSLTTEDRDKNFKALQEQMNEDYSFYPMANTNYVMVARKEFKGLDAIKRVPIFEDYTKITMEK